MLHGLILSYALVGSSCVSHLHNESDAKKAAEAEAKLAELATTAPQSYAAMKANIERFKVEEEYLMKEVNSNALTSEVTLLPTMSWTDVNKRVEEAQTKTAEFADQVAREAGTYHAASKEWEKKKDDAAAAVGAAKKRLSDAKAQVAAWNKSIAVLQQGIADTQANIARLSKDASFQTLTDIAEDASKSVVTYKDADGKDQTAKVFDVLADDLKAILAALRAKDQAASTSTQTTQQVVADGGKGAREVTTTTTKTKTKKAKGLLPDAPGIAVVLANLTLDTAKVRLAVAEDELDYREQRAHLFEDAYAQMLIARKLVDEMDIEAMGPGNLYIALADDWRNHTEDRASYHEHFLIVQKLSIKQKDTPPLSTQEQAELESAKGKMSAVSQQLLDSQDSNAKRLQTLRKLAVADSIILRNRTVFPVACERLAHQHSVSLSAISDQAHHALFKTTIAGLRAYHDGGMKKEDVANFISLAQAVALGSIAKSLN